MIAEYTTTGENFLNPSALLNRFVQTVWNVHHGYSSWGSLVGDIEIIRFLTVFRIIFPELTPFVKL